MDAGHFERMAAEYADARPPYPAAVFDALIEVGALGPGRDVLEVGAGTGLATAELVARGARVLAVEPGEELSALVRASVPGVEVVTARLEDAALPTAAYDSVLAATALHWVDLDLALPLLHRVLRPGGMLAVWRTVFGDHTVHTAFRDRVAQVVAGRGEAPRVGAEGRPTPAELSAGGFFAPIGPTRRWRWSVDLDTEAVRRLFASFSDWSDDEVARVAAAADELGGTVTEHYQTVLHVLRATNRRAEPAR